MTDLTQVFRDTISPDKTIRNNAEQSIQELLRNPEFISSLPGTYMVSNDKAVSQVSATIYKNNVNKITNKELILQTSLNALIKILTEENIEGMKTHIYKLHCEVLKKTIINRDLFEFSAKYINITNLHVENFVNNILALEILYIETQRTVYRKYKKNEQNTFYQFFEFFMNLLKSNFNKQSKVYYELLFKIFKYVFEHYRIDKSEEISICITEAILYCENINLRTPARKFAQELISIGLSKLFDIQEDKDKIWENALFLNLKDFSIIDKIFQISYGTLFSFIKEGGIETLDSYGKAETEDLTDILFSCALIFQNIFEKKELCINYAAKFPQIFDEIYLPFMSLNVAKLDLFLSDGKEFYTATCSPYIQGLSDLFETATVDFIECCTKISTNDYSFISNIYEYLLQKCISYDQKKGLIDPQVLMSLNNSNVAYNIINNAQGEVEVFIKLMNQKYACLRILAMLSYSAPEGVKNFNGEKYALAAIKTVLADFQTPLKIMQSTACFFLEQFYPEDENRYSPEFINITDEILNIIIQKMMIKEEIESTRLVATQAMLFYIDDRSNTDVHEYQNMIENQRQKVISNMTIILNNFISITGTRNKEVLDYLMEYYPNDIKHFVPPLIIALVKKIEENGGNDKELITEYLMSIGELILMISLLKNLGTINMIEESKKIEELFNSVAPIIQKNMKDTHYLPEFIDLLSNFVFSMCNSLPVLPYMDRIMQFNEDELINVIEEVERAMDNIISFSNPYVFYGIDNLINFVDFTQMTKYAVSYKCILKEEFNKNLYVQITEERKGKIIVKQNIKNDLSPLVIGAIDFLNTIFNNVSLIDMMNQQSIMIERTLPEKTEKILYYVLRFKETVFQYPNSITEEDIILLSKIYEALSLNLINKTDTSFIMKLVPEIFSCMFLALKQIDNSGVEAVFICNVFINFFIRDPALIQQMGNENFKKVLEIMHKTKSLSSRLHERSLLLLFFARIIALPFEQIFLDSLNTVEEELRILAGIFSASLNEHFEYVIERNYMTEEDEEWFNELCEDPNYQSILDHIDVISLLKDIVPTCQPGSLFVNLIKFIPDEDREKFMQLLSRN